MADLSFVLRVPPSGPVVTGTPGYVLTFDADGRSVSGQPGGGPGGVQSVFGRTGDVVAEAGDYDASEVTNDSTVAGATVAAALDTLAALGPGAVTSVFGRMGAITAELGDYSGSLVTNDSTVAGATVSDALDTLAGMTAAVSSVFGRIGDVVAEFGDYDASQVNNDSSVFGASVSEALDSLGALATVQSVFTRSGEVVAELGDYSGSLVTNDSTVAGATVSDALDTLAAAASPVSSVFGRIGEVVAASGDYDASEVANDSTVAGASVAAALDTLAASIVTISGSAPISVAAGVVSIADPSNISKGAVPLINTANGALVANGAGTACTWALLTGSNISSAAALVVTSGSFSSFVGLGATQSSIGALRLTHGSTVYGRNNSNTTNNLLWDWGSTAADVLAFSVVPRFTSGLSIGANAATAGALRLAHGSQVQGRDNANSANVSLWNWGSTTNDVLTIVAAPNFSNGLQSLGNIALTTGYLSFGATASTTGTAINFTHNRTVYGRNSANNADAALYDWGSTTANVLTFGANTTFRGTLLIDTGAAGVLAIGGTVATTGNMRVAQGYTMNGRNNANSADVAIYNWGSTTTDVFTVAANTTFLGTVVINGSYIAIGANASTAGTAINFAYGRTVYGRNSANNADTQLFDWGVGIANGMVFYPQVTFNGVLLVNQVAGAVLRFGNLPASAGNVRVSTAWTLAGRNVANNANATLLDWGATADTLTVGSSGFNTAINAANLGFFGATPVARPAAVGALTDSTTGTPSTTLVDVGAVPTQASINNNFASVLTKLNAINTKLSQAAGGLGITA